MVSKDLGWKGAKKPDTTGEDRPVDEAWYNENNKQQARYSERSGIFSLPETNSSPPKSGWLEYVGILLSCWGDLFFFRYYVSFREGRFEGLERLRKSTRWWLQII